MAADLTVSRGNATKLTRKGVDAIVEQLLQGEYGYRKAIVLLWEGRADEACGYTDWEKFYREVAHLNAEKNVIARAIRWGQVEATIGSRLPRDQAEQLYRLWRLGEADMRGAYDECTVLHTSDSGKVYRSPRFITDLTHIVNRMLKGIEPPKPDTPDTPDTPTAEPEPEAPAIPASATAEATLAASIPVSETDGEEIGEGECEKREGWEEGWENRAERAAEQQARKEAGLPQPLDWEEGLKTALTWAENQNIDGDKSVRSSVVTVLCAVAEWIAEAK